MPSVIQLHQRIPARVAVLLLGNDQQLDLYEREASQFLQVFGAVINALGQNTNDTARLVHEVSC